MERRTQNKRTQNKLTWLSVIITAASMSARADTQMLPPAEKPIPKPGEGYAESRFGAQPSRVNTGLSDYTASKEVNQWDAAVEGGRTISAAPSREPASGDAAQQAATRDARNSAPSDLPSDVDAQGAARRKGVQEVAVIASDLGFFPKTLFVTRDIPVRIFVTGSSKHSLCMMMDSFQVRKQIRTNKIEEISFTPSLPGKYRFYCPVNGAEGTLVVKELGQQVVQN